MVATPADDLLNKTLEVAQCPSGRTDVDRWKFQALLAVALFVEVIIRKVNHKARGGHRDNGLLRNVAHIGYSKRDFCVVKIFCSI
jgi:hypothetical protein